ncbi:alpha/beta hydrolase [Bacillus sp. PS06]|uniref:alpha/beta hydrolase n=1 Tax=Bacillus sp. PS06 TaxID=2764176 RepID=UPI00177BD406|nr:alpha/beta hydrolase [Bacillus sp. PS06]MBD8070081.1 alpha/beta hydrolase [Bacillus sp. PS06]
MTISNRFPFRLIEQKEETNNLVIVLPGAGYTTQAPLLHYTTGLFHSKGFDVLHVNYSFNREELSVLNGEEFAQDVQFIIDHAIKNKPYRQIYIVAKSVGTIALSYLLNHTMFKDSKVVWLTPLLQRADVLNAMVQNVNKGLCLIGDNDPCFIPERFELLKNNQHLVSSVIEGGNHALELENEPIDSIDILKRVISDINEL